ncbi:MAG: 4'-phosphopantetheinyl transferase superfamily protein, partial [Rhodospirillales bacterium]|nr:4'-phosphopantetheinyl transferase superfamily protein [Rhodospirillales bacterium]
YRSVVKAVDKRKREFNTGRICAREALGKLGEPSVAIPVGPDRRPVWPPLVVGSITHCQGYCAAAVAWKHDIRALGIDAEPHQALHDGMLEMIASPQERACIYNLAREEPDIHWDRVLFSCKESVYKAVNSNCKLWLDFEDVEVFFQGTKGLFFARTSRQTSTLSSVPIEELVCKWSVVENVILTAAILIEYNND